MYAPIRSDVQCFILHSSFHYNSDVFSAGVSDIEVIDKPKEIEPPADPAHAIIKSNKETVIEINVNNKPLGLFVSGGKMLQPPVVN